MKIPLHFKFILLLMLSAVAASAQQSGSIKGKITTADGQPAAYVSIGLKNKTLGTTTSENGDYTLNKVKPGNYTLRVSAVGINTQEQNINVAAGETLVLNFKLTENSEFLKEITISTAKKSYNVAKMPLKNLENPQVYTSVSSETMKQQAISNYDDALRNVPGITRTWESTGRGGDGGSYFSLRGFEAQPSLVNGLPGLVSGNLDPANVEEIQVMKGPSGTLFGASFYGYGGIINTITKKPYYNFGGEVSYNIGSFGLHRLAVDLNTPLSKTKKIAFRLNTALHTEKSFQDAGFKKSLFIAPSLSYEVNDKLSFNLLVEILEEKRAVAPIFFNSDRVSPLDFKNIAELNLNNKLSFTNNDLTIKNPRKNLQAQAVYKFDSKWSSQTVFSASNIKSDGLYSYIWGVDPDKPTQRNYFYQYFSNQDFNTSTIDLQQNFNGDFKIGKLRNRLLIGLDYFTRTVKNNSSGWIATRLVNPQGGIISLNPSNPDGLNQSAITTALAATEHSNTKITNSTYSAYASNVLNITPSLTAMLSLRMDYFKNKANVSKDDYNQLTFSPKFGLVYQPILDKVSIFANYMNAFYNIAPYEVFDNAGVSLGVKSFQPERANQIEFGVKTNLLSDKLFATISAYDTKVANRVYFSPTSAMQGGKTQSRGIELEVNAIPLPELNLIAGFSHGKIKVIEGNQATPNDFYNEVGRSPGGQGPQTLANFWATYKFSSGKLKDFGLGLGGNYAGVYKVIDNSVTGVFNLPSYALLNASVFYNSRKIRVTCNVNNLTNETYYAGYWSVNPQKPRNFTASLSYKL
ncbi:TonB-dependent receptor [Pedobacter sp. Hv1]|uniref:TonB-dependent receptor n=1 Tax=Pedobacter sp. Hv1 TaxID=1740090 RepID=UPI0006D8C422|nr:TonB-dependent receptor [Pedobacter sp. Hv1]KQC01588.1 TonB-dependent receptor [Pedobacter sp. Hv1]